MLGLKEISHLHLVAGIHIKVLRKKEKKKYFFRLAHSGVRFFEVLVLVLSTLKGCFLFEHLSNQVFFSAQGLCLLIEAAFGYLSYNFLR